MSFPRAVRSALSKYATFSGRSRRSEFWWFYLFVLLAWFAAAVLDAASGAVDGNTGYGVVFLIAFVALLPPYLAVAVRRLHDTGRSGWWLLITVLPVIGTLVLLALFALRGEPGANQWGQCLDDQSPDDRSGAPDVLGGGVGPVS